MRMWCLRNLRKNGASVYLAIPRVARQELGLFVGDCMVIELDTDLKCLLVRPIAAHGAVPELKPWPADMLPVVENPTGDAEAAQPVVHRALPAPVEP